MAKFVSFTLAVLMTFLVPSFALAGPAGPECDVVAPNFNASTGSSGLWFFNSGTGENAGADQNDGTTSGSGALPDLISGDFTNLGDDVYGYPDLNGDGITDTVQVSSGGYTYAYIMESDGAGWLQVADDGAVPGLITSDFKWVGFPDLNGDNKTDLCQATATGFIYCYLMDGLTVLGSGQIAGPITVDFKIIGFTDMDGNGSDDTVIQHPGGFTYTYLMEPDGGTFVQTLDQGPTGSLITTDFATTAFTDINGDDKSDIVTQHPGGFTYVFLQDGITNISQGAIAGLITTDFVTVGFPDMDGNGFADHVMQATSGFTYAYLTESDGGTFVQTKGAGEVSPPITPDFARRGFPDLNCDGKADITYQASGGFTVAYLAGSSGFADTATQVTLEAPPAGSVTRDWDASWSVLPDVFAP